MDAAGRLPRGLARSRHLRPGRGLSLFTLQITHKIDEDTDRERDHIVAGLCSAEPAARLQLIRDFSSGCHSRNGGGDTIQTDGDLPVVDLGGVP